MNTSHVRCKLGWTEMEDKAGEFAVLPLYWGQEVFSGALSSICFFCFNASVCVVRFFRGRTASSKMKYPFHCFIIGQIIFTINCLTSDEETNYFQQLCWNLEYLASEEESWVACLSESPQLLDDSECCPKLFCRFSSLMIVCVCSDSSVYAVLPSQLDILL